jgi:hypothetical protein
MAKAPQGAPNYERRFPGFKEQGGGEGWNWQWDTVGQELIGTFLSIEPFRNGHKAKVREADGTVRLFSAATVLADLLLPLERGDEIAIIFTHQDSPKSKGQTGVKHFKLLKREDEG